MLKDTRSQARTSPISKSQSNTGNRIKGQNGDTSRKPEHEESDASDTLWKKLKDFAGTSVKLKSTKIHSFRKGADSLYRSQAHPAVAVGVDGSDHLGQLRPAGPPPQPHRAQHRPQLLHRDEPIPVHIEHVERLLQLLVLADQLPTQPLPITTTTRAAVSPAGDVHGFVEDAELLEVQGAVAVDVQPRHHGVQVGFRDEEAEVLQRVLQLLPSDEAVVVVVERREDAAELRLVGCLGARLLARKSLAEEEKEKKRKMKRRRKDRSMQGLC
ncbi:hypothetical protein EJ110_NYTH49111 [Nymphaea thermarum]|nr:hypothetical protein EJ110_NYTH49111 [Nymphaea thermarum]